MSFNNFYNKYGNVLVEYENIKNLRGNVGSFLNLLCKMTYIIILFGEIVVFNISGYQLFSKCVKNHNSGGVSSIMCQLNHSLPLLSLIIVYTNIHCSFYLLNLIMFCLNKKIIISDYINLYILK